ncbi:hypothetical protein ACRN9Z_14060 [Shewanella frigidimarina]|uniref:hypothetical protein n=1 Tax=Shewanella frigidimarina TaxID=56812 RepID=UPI003D7A9B43
MQLLSVVLQHQALIICASFTKRYQAVSSGIKRYQAVSSGIKRYQAVSSGIKRYQAVSSEKSKHLQLHHTSFFTI